MEKYDTQTLDPATGQRDYRSETSSSHSSSVDRFSEGDGSYSHNRHGYLVSGTASTLSSYNYESLTELNQVYVNGVCSAESGGTQFTDRTTRNRMSINGSGIDDRVVVTAAPYYNSNVLDIFPASHPVLAWADLPVV